MPNIVSISHKDRQAPYPAPCCRVEGDSTGSFGEAFSLWVVTGVLGAGAELVWGADHGEETIFVIDGMLVLDGQSCGRGGSLIIEAGVVARLRAVETTEVVHFGSSGGSAGTMGPPGLQDRTAHVVRFEDADYLKVNSQSGAVFEQHFYADSTCDTCRVTLFKVKTDGPSFAAPHHHTEDEIIHVLDGEMRVGTIVVAAGCSIGIRRNARYSFKTSAPIEFLNFRSDASYIIANSQTPPVLETVAAKRKAYGID